MRLLWSLAAAGLLAAGCASGAPAQRAVTPTVAPSVSAAGGNQQKAEVEAQRLVGEVRLPSGSVRAPQSIAPSLSGPVMGRPGVGSLVDRDALWRVPLSLPATLSWISSHVPAGLTPSGSMAGAGYGFSAPRGPAWQSAELDVGAASISSTVTAVRADGVVVWLDSTPMRDTASGPRLRVTVSHGCPSSDAGYVGVSNPGATDLGSQLLPAGRPDAALVCEYGRATIGSSGLTAARHLDAAAAAKVAAVVASVPLSHTDGGITDCPAAFSTAVAAAFAYPGRPDVDLWVSPTGCATVANGDISAWGDPLSADAQP